MGEQSTGGRTPKDIRRQGAHPDKILSAQDGERKLGEFGILDQPRVLTPGENAINKAGFGSPEVAAYFRGRELPTNVIVPPGVAYYNKPEDIPTESFPHRTTHLKIEAYEHRAGISLEVYPPDKGEPPDASFRFIGERGLYVRVIRFKEKLVDKQLQRTRIVSWTPFNEIGEDTDLAKIRRV